MRKTNYRVKSSSGEFVDVNCYEAENPKGLVQILHGMQEHKERYDDFARFLVDRGYCVLTHDHLGHGKSISQSHPLGDMISFDFVVKDIDLVRKSFDSQLPYICFGHSMGSFLARIYSSLYSVDKLVACGSGQNPNLLIGLMGFLLSFNKSRHPLPGFQKLLMSNLGKKFANPADWLSLNKENQRKYMEDSLCGQPFTKEGYKVLLDIMKNLNNETTYSNCTAKDILLISGKQDPVGNFGKGIEYAEKKYRDCGKSVASILYDNMTHEILNETDNLKVYEDVLNFLEK